MVNAVPYFHDTAFFIQTFQKFFHHDAELQNQLVQAEANNNIFSNNGIT